VGTKKMVNRADTSIPPITTRAIGAFISDPSPNPRAMGTSARQVVRVGYQDGAEASLSSTENRLTQGIPPSPQTVDVVYHDNPVVYHDADKEHPPINTGSVTFMLNSNNTKITPIEAKGTVNMITNGSVSDSNFEAMTGYKPCKNNT
jgi:hypothetical protein